MEPTQSLWSICVDCDKKTPEVIMSDEKELKGKSRGLCLARIEKCLKTWLKKNNDVFSGSDKKNLKTSQVGYIDVNFLYNDEIFMWTMWI